MKRLILEDYTQEKFSNNQAVCLSRLGERLNKYYFAPNRMNQKTVDECNRITQEMIEFMNNRTPENALLAWDDLFIEFHQSFQNMSRQGRTLLRMATGLPLKEIITERGLEANFEIWQKLTLFTDDIIKEDFTKETASALIGYRLIGKNVQAHFADVDKRIKGEGSAGILPEDLKCKIQEELDNLSLAALVLPGNVLNKKRIFTSILNKVKDSSVHLAEATGWGKEALGLKGRVVLMPGCLYKGSMGTCSAVFKTGDQAYDESPIFINTQAWNPDWYTGKKDEIDYMFEALGHEWMHALDYCSDSRFFNKPLENMRQTLDEFSADLDAIDPSGLNREKIIQEYKDKLMEDFRRTPNDTFKESVNEILEKNEFSQGRALYFLDQIKELSEEKRVSILIQLSVLHKIIHEPLEKLPFLLRNEKMEENAIYNGKEAYLSLPSERLAYSFEGSLNRGNPLNTVGSFGVSLEEGQLLRKKWKEVFKHHRYDFEELAPSNAVVDEPSMSDYEDKKSHTRDFWVQMLSTYRIWQERGRELSEKMLNKKTSLAPHKKPSFLPQ